jgi:outer membrane protein assembly factor BamB
MFVAAALVVAVVATCTLAAQSQAPDTKTDPANRIIALDPRWSVAFDTAPIAPAGFDDQAAYLPLKGGELVAVGLERGDVRWKVPLSTAHTPSTEDGFVFAASGEEVLALEERSGAIAWKQPLGAALAAPVSWDAGMLWAATAGELVALSADSGSILWRLTLQSPISAPPASAGDRLFVGLEDHRVVAFDRASGAPIWTSKVADTVTGLLALDDQVIAGTQGNHLYSFSTDKGRLKWNWRVGGDITGAATADEDRIYFAARDNVLRALDRRTGNLKWMQPLPSRPSGNPIRAADVVIMPTVSADIGAYSAETGKLSFTIKASGEVGSVPFLREGARPTAPRLIAVTREGTLQGFAARHEPPPVPLQTLPGTRASR